MTKPLPVLTLALALAMAAPLAATAQDDDAFARGVAAYEDGNYETAAELWAPLAKDGAPEAQRNLAQLYRLGLGVERDNERAFELYTAAAEQNSVQAQVNAAFLLLTGEGVDKDPKQAALWFAKASDQGDALAQFNLGLMYEKGVGVPRDTNIARELYQLSANQGQKRALARLDAIEDDLPPDGGEKARQEREDAKAKQDARDAAAERERKQQEAAVKRAEDRAKAEAQAKADSRIEKAKAQAKTGPILIIEKIEDKPKAAVRKPDVKPVRKPAPAKPAPARATAGADKAAGADKGAAGAMKATRNVEEAFRKGSLAPDETPPTRRKPQEIGKPDRMETAGPRDADAFIARSQMDRIRQVKDAEIAYDRGDFRTSARLLMPLAQGGMPVAQFWLGRMFNRGEGVMLDRYEAYTLWRSAAASGSERAATALANLSNRLGPEELARAEAYFQEKAFRMSQQPLQ